MVGVVAITPDGSRIVSGSRDSTLRVWDMETGAELLVLRGHLGEVNAISVSPDSAQVVSGSGDCSLKLWSLCDGRLIAEFPTDGIVTSCAFTSDGRGLIAGDSSGNVHFLAIENCADLAQGHLIAR